MIDIPFPLALVIVAAVIGLVGSLFIPAPRLPDPGTNTDEIDEPQQGLSTHDRAHDSQIMRAAEVL